MCAAKPSQPWNVRKLILGFLVTAVVCSFPGRVVCQSQASGPLAGTTELTAQGDLAAKMVEGIQVYLKKQTAQTGKIRQQATAKALGQGPQAVAQLRSQRKEKLRSSLGVQKKPHENANFQWVGGPEQPALVVEKNGVKVSRVRWNALVDLPWEGLLIEPSGPAKSSCILWPHADQTPEETAGITEKSKSLGLGWQLASQGCRVLIPVIISRESTHSGNPKLNRFTNQPHREFVYRMLYEMGRTPLGLEVEATRAAIGWLLSKDKKPLMVVGYGDGGRVALMSAALDERIDGCWVRGAFGPREGMWTEPIDRNTWDLLNHLGDAEIVELIAPRYVLLENCPSPTWEGPGKVPNRAGAAPGKLSAISLEQAMAEKARIDLHIWPKGKTAPQLVFIEKETKNADKPKYPSQQKEANTEHTKMLLGRFLETVLGDKNSVKDQTIQPSEPPTLSGENLPNNTLREGNQVAGVIEYCQRLWRTSENSRSLLWKGANPANPHTFPAEASKLRTYFHQEVIGQLPPPSLPMNPKSRPWKNGKNWKGFEVTLDLEPGVFAYGILLLPNDLKLGEKRPVVVCQHGLEGRPSDVCEPEKNTAYYNSFGATLADRGYIVFAPQNCYIGQDKFRVLQRLANPLKLSLFSFIIRQHERIIDWLKLQSWTEPEKIAFYGLSYGGKTAMRVPAILPGYCLSICSGDFNEWIGKNVSYDFPGSYLYTGEYEMFEFNLGHTFNYAEMAWLIAPRPFFVERGHDDGVGTDEMVAWEFARVRRFYSRLKMPEKTGIAFFPGGHEVQGAESFPWLDKQLGFTPTKR